MSHDLPQIIIATAAAIFLLAFLLSARARRRLRKENGRLRKKLDQAREELAQTRMVLHNLEHTCERMGQQAVQDRRELETFRQQPSPADGDS